MLVKRFILLPLLVALITLILAAPFLTILVLRNVLRLKFKQRCSDVN